MTLQRLLIKHRGSLEVVPVVPKYVVERAGFSGRQFWWVLVFCMYSRQVLLFWQTTGMSDCMSLLLLPVNFLNSGTEQHEIPFTFSFVSLGQIVLLSYDRTGSSHCPNVSIFLDRTIWRYWMFHLLCGMHKIFYSIFWNASWGYSLLMELNND